MRQVYISDSANSMDQLESDVDLVRTGSVWNSGDIRRDGSSTYRKTQDSNNYPLISPNRSKATDNGAKRREAALWIRQVTGVEIAFSSDYAFRSCLKDGVILCSILNVVYPGHVPKVRENNQGSSIGEHMQQLENVDNFLKGICRREFPSNCMFDLADLTSDGNLERPRITDCLLHLKKLHEDKSDTLSSPLQSAYARDTSPKHSLLLAQQQQQGGVLSFSPGVFGGHQLPRFPQLSSSSPTSGADSSPPQQLEVAASGSRLPLGYGGSSHGGSTMAGNSGGALVSPALTSATARSLQANVGITKLMHTCSMMLQQRMTSQGSDSLNLGGGLSGAIVAGSGGGATTSGPSTWLALQQQNGNGMAGFDAVGPVLESVLGGLTQEYEKRLLNKDHELNEVKGQMNRNNQHMQMMETQLEQFEVQMEAEKLAAQENARIISAEAVAQLQRERAQLQAQLAEKEAVSNQLQDRLEGLDSNRDNRARQLEGQLEEAQQRIQQLALVETSYKSTQEENRKLYNLVQDLKGSIRVFCRVRPLGQTGDSSQCCLDTGIDGELAIYDAKGERKMFKFDRVFGQDSTQQEVYVDTQPLIRSVLDGYNVCIFAYGQTGSGKTHTMTGSNVQHMSGRGINYRALDDLFSLRDARSDEVQYEIKVQMLEIYNETLRDLLCHDSARGTRLDILTTQASGCNVPGVTQLDVCTTDDVMDMMHRGAKNRHSAETKMNERSSRSHQVMSVIVDGVNFVTGARSHGCLHLVDLAGSERVAKSEATGDRLVEANHINKSLSALGGVMHGLANKQAHVPFRDSKLTLLLQDSLSGNGKVMMFMHVSPEASSYAESVGTIKFGTRVSEISLGQAKKNVESGEVFKAHEELSKLQGQLARKEASFNAQLQKEREEKESMARQLEEMKKLYTQSMRSTSSDAGDGGSTSRGVPPQRGSATSASQASLAILSIPSIQQPSLPSPCCGSSELEELEQQLSCSSLLSMESESLISAGARSRQVTYADGGAQATGMATPSSTSSYHTARVPAPSPRAYTPNGTRPVATTPSSKPQLSTTPRVPTLALQSRTPSLNSTSKATATPPIKTPRATGAVSSTAPAVTPRSNASRTPPAAATSGSLTARRMSSAAGAASLANGGKTPRSSLGSQQAMAPAAAKQGVAIASRAVMPESAARHANRVRAAAQQKSGGASSVAIDSSAKLANTFKARALPNMTVKPAVVASVTSRAGNTYGSSTAGHMTARGGVGGCATIPETASAFTFDPASRLTPGNMTTGARRAGNGWTGR